MSSRGGGCRWTMCEDLPFLTESSEQVLLLTSSNCFFWVYDCLEGERDGEGEGGRETAVTFRS